MLDKKLTELTLDELKDLKFHAESQESITRSHYFHEQSFALLAESKAWTSLKTSIIHEMASREPLRAALASALQALEAAKDVAVDCKEYGVVNQLEEAIVGLGDAMA